MFVQCFGKKGSTRGSQAQRKNSERSKIQCAATSEAQASQMASAAALASTHTTQTGSTANTNADRHEQVTSASTAYWGAWIRRICATPWKAWRSNGRFKAADVACTGASFHGSR